MKKSFYIFLSALLGVMLFILLQRSLFLLAFLLGVNVLSPEFAEIDYGSFILSMFLGLWYGIWVGLYWFNLVYEEQAVPGMFRSMWGRFRPGQRDTSPILAEESGKSWNLEDLMKAKAEEYKAEGLEPDLRVFESNTVAFSAPVHASDLHREAPKKQTRAKRTVKRTTKRSTKTSA